MVDDKECPVCGAVLRWKYLEKPTCDVCNDKEFEDRVVKKAIKTANGWDVRFSDGWMFYVPLTDSVVIKPGDTVRMYGKGVGYAVRGLVIGDKVIYYRSEAAEEVYQKEQRFGATAADWLERWKSGKTVWSVEMGGFGPGYEQCIQITAAKILEHLLETKPDMERAVNDDAYWKDVSKGIVEAIKPVDEKLGLIGAQFGAAQNLAMTLYRRGPIEALSDPKVKDRLIQVSKTFPSFE